MKIHPDIHPSLHGQLYFMCGFLPGMAVSSFILSFWFPDAEGLAFAALMTFLLVLAIMKCGRIPGTPKHRKYYDDDCAP